jgi:hypothetical protein
MEVTAEDFWYEGNWYLFCVFCCLFTRTFYRVFILWCEYPTRQFSFHVYKGNEKMGIRKMMTWQGNILKYKWSERTVREWTHENEETSWRYAVIQREWTNGVLLHLWLWSQIKAFLGYLLLQVTSTHHHHSLLDHCNCIASSAVTGAVPSDSKSMSWMGWPDVDICQRWRWKRQQRQWLRWQRQ